MLLDAAYHRDVQWLTRNLWSGTLGAWIGRMTAVAVATNSRLLRKWAARTGDRTHALCAVDLIDHGFKKRDADGNPDLALAPPVEA